MALRLLPLPAAALALGAHLLRSRCAVGAPASAGAASAWVAAGMVEPWRRRRKERCSPPRAALAPQPRAACLPALPLLLQARLVQSQQRTIQAMEAAVGKAVVQSTTAVTAAEAAATVASAAHREAGGAFSRDGAPQAAAGQDGLDPPGSGLLAAPSAAAAVVGARGAAAGGGMIDRVKAEAAAHDAAVAGAALHDRRLVGLYDARYHSTSWCGSWMGRFRCLKSAAGLVQIAGCVLLARTWSRTPFLFCFCLCTLQGRDATGLSHPPLPHLPGAALHLLLPS